jgi:hypothetical protein
MLTLATTNGDDDDDDDDVARIGSERCQGALLARRGSGHPTISTQTTALVMYEQHSVQMNGHT